MVKRIISVFIIAVIVISAVTVNVVALMDSTRVEVAIDPVYGYQCDCKLIVGTKYATVTMDCSPTSGTISNPTSLVATYCHNGDVQLSYDYRYGYPDCKNAVTMPESCDNVRAHYGFMNEEVAKLTLDVPN